MKEFIRQATPQELHFYQNILYPFQDEIFKIAKLYENKIYLTGGTALSRFYFNHRLSEDLDFFTTSDDLKLVATDFIARLKNKGFSIEIDRLELYFARFFVARNKCQIKVDFAREYNLWGKLVKTNLGININSLDDIGANKITAFEDRAEIKDIIDLYYITEKISFDRLLEIADMKRVPVPYETLLTINMEGISGLVFMIEQIDQKKLEFFINKLKRKVEDQIKKKEKQALNNTKRIIRKILWDFPPDARIANKQSIPVLKRRLEKLPLPEKTVLEKIVTSYC